MSFVYESNDASMIRSIMDRGELSYRAAKVILEQEQETAEQTQEPIELDPVALRGMWAEYETVEDMVNDMGWEDHIVRVDGEIDAEETLECVEHYVGCVIIRVDHDGPFLVKE